MSSVTTQLAALLRTVKRPGDFCTAGTIDIATPRLEVDGVGIVAMPLLPVQASQLVAAAERAPYGRGEETVVDTAVRRTWQIAADRVRVGGKHWPRTLETVLARVSAGLGVSEPITAELYKLLIYDQGSFFVSHRDTEKVPGMFATLVLALPAESAGGELVVRHKDREARLDLRCDDPSEAAFAAFYADCVHEVLPVTAGCRLVLVYSLVRQSKGPKPTPPNYDVEQTRATALLQTWASNERSPRNETPEKIVFPLEHAYTPAELGFDALKGADAAIAGVLLAAAPKAGCDLHIALLSIEESGMAEYEDGGSRRREPDLVAGDVEDRYVRLSEWRRPDGGRPALTEVPVEDEEISPPDAFDDMEPDDEDFTEATGNEGATFERTYSRAALVLWPSTRATAVLNQAGLPVTLPYLADLADRWVAGGADRQSSLWSQAHDLAGHMLSTWRKDHWYPRESEGPSDVTRMLIALTRLRDTTRLEALLSDIVTRGFDKADIDAILDAFALLPPNRITVLTGRIIAAAATLTLGACGRLLARVAAALPAGHVAGLSAAAAALIRALPDGKASERGSGQVEYEWRRDRKVEPAFIVDLVAGVVPVDEVLTARVVDHILTWPNPYDLDAVVIPAVRKLIAQPAIMKSPTVQRLQAACVRHLRARIAEPLEAPKDWTRASTVGCKCPHCVELKRFLAHPLEKAWILRAATPDRSHVEEAVRRAKCDLDMRTEQRGRPYSLVCTKNQASYDRRVAQRREDVADLDRLT